MKSELTNFPYKIVDISTGDGVSLHEQALSHISNCLKSMDPMQKMDMENGKETKVRLKFDEIEVSSVIVMARSVVSICLTLMLSDEKNQIIMQSDPIESASRLPIGTSPNFYKVILKN